MSIPRILSAEEQKAQAEMNERREKMQKLQDQSISVQERSLEHQERMLKVLSSKRSVKVEFPEGQPLNFKSVDIVNAGDGFYTLFFEAENKLIRIPSHTISRVEETLL